MRRFDLLAASWKEREERVLRAYHRGQATPHEVQYWACMTALAVCKGELGAASPGLLRRLLPPGGGRRAA